MNDKKQIFGWAMYDWANSAFVTTVSVAILPILFADVIVGQEGFTLGGRTFSASCLWAFMIGLVALVIFLIAPVLGSIADYSASKKKFLFVFCYGGSFCTLLLIFCGQGDVWLTIILFSLAQIGFVGGNVFYDAFLPQIASEDKLDWVSGKGYAYGYIGGGLQFALSLILIAGHETLGISEILASRIAIISAGLWWAGFAIITFLYLKENEAQRGISTNSDHHLPLFSFIFLGVRRTIQTAQKVKRFKHLFIFLIAYMIYNDGIQTVIDMATMYGREELRLSSRDLLQTLLIIQVVAIFGALIFGKLGEKLSTKTALFIALALWSFVVIYAYKMTTAGEYYFLGVIVGITLGGSQALSRSLYGSMIPPQASAEFFGFYTVFSKFSAIWGPFLFGLINAISGSSRQAIVSLVAFFIVGMVLLSFVNVKKAKEAKVSPLFSEARD
jgi:MFS transporter, UMF1 family